MRAAALRNRKTRNFDHVIHMLRLSCSTTEPVAMSEVHKAARENMARKGTAFDSAFHAAQQVRLSRLPIVVGVIVG